MKTILEYKKIILNIAVTLALFGSFVFMVQSCGDCNLVATEYPCRVREGTIPQFDPRLEIKPGDTTLSVVATYNTQLFQFPSDNSSSGSLKNDSRYETTDSLAQLAQVTYNDPNTGETLIAKFMSMYPGNASLVADVMVVSVDLGIKTANLRFAGNVAKFAKAFNYEDAYRFCTEYLPDYRSANSDENYTKIGAQATPYGMGLANATTASNSGSIRIYNVTGRDVTAQYLATLPKSVADQLTTAKAATGVDLTVRIGDVYYYKSTAGKEFAVIVSNIFQGSLDPFIRRVTLRFSELKSQTSQQCKP